MNAILEKGPNFRQYIKLNPMENMVVNIMFG